MVSRYAVVRDGLVENVVLWDGKSDWTPPEGCTAHTIPDGSSAGPGWTRAKNGRYVAPESVEQEPAAAQVMVDPAALAAFVTAVSDPASDSRQALADFAAALSTDS